MEAGDSGPRFQVVAYSGYQGEQEPRALVAGERRLEVVDIGDRWYDPRARYFRVKASDGGDYLLRYDLEELGWSVRRRGGTESEDGKGRMRWQRDAR